MNTKRNLAMVMAAATVVTSVAPVFAAEVESLDGQTVGVKDSAKLEQLKKEVQALLSKKYTANKDLLSDDTLAGTKVFNVKIQLNNDAETPISNISELNAMLLKLEESDDKVNISAEVKLGVGYKEVDGNVVDNKVKVYTDEDITNLLGMDLKTQINTLEQGLVTNVDSTNKEIYLTVRGLANPIVLKAGEKIVVNPVLPLIDDSQVLFKKDSLGQMLDKDGEVTTDREKAVILGVNPYKYDLEPSDFKAELNYTIANTDVISGTVKASDLYDFDINRFSIKGNEVFKFIKDYKALAGAPIEAKLVDGELRLTANETKKGLTNQFTNLTITGTKNEISTIYDALNGKYSGAVATQYLNLTKDDDSLADKTAGLYRYTLAGMNRMQTAVEISKELDTTAGVVLVSGANNADGLAATPFAARKNASILLSDKDSIPADVMKEIKRINGTVYIVGGNNSISDKVESQLDSQFINYERISGVDRADTSLELAKELGATPSDLFVANGKAEADAMSSASIAAAQYDFGTAKTAGYTPILLTKDDGLTSAQKSWLKNKTIGKIYAVGGTSSLSNDVLNSLETNSDNVKRLAGDNRQGTNAAVLHEFFSNENSINSVYVAKSADNGLVDALAAGVLAAKTHAPLVLASENLNADQTAVIKANKAKFTTIGGSQTQIGYNVNKAVWSALENLLK
ncbi:MAG: cell wall-binding repeat-containing protein [Clostridioides sp.]|jgi:putative cell wall-binding protein|nr:cell wall-binding repeat-containing protein [Clostridioides sp.]